jgi:hypothetical protein
MEPPQKKVVVESKIKGPKRLGQGVHGIGIGKKKHQETVDSDDVEEQISTEIITDASGAPIDIQSVGLDFNWIHKTKIYSFLDSLLEILYKQSHGYLTKTSFKSSIKFH